MGGQNYAYIRRRMPPCTFPGCSDQQTCRGLCERHYQRLRMHGDPADKLTGKQPSGGIASAMDDFSESETMIEIAGEERGGTERGLRLFDGVRTVWLPRHLVTQSEPGVFAMPEWLAKDRGLI